MAVQLNLGTSAGRPGSPLPAAVANPRVLVCHGGAHGAPSLLFQSCQELLWCRRALPPYLSWNPAVELQSRLNSTRPPSMCEPLAEPNPTALYPDLLPVGRSFGDPIGGGHKIALGSFCEPTSFDDGMNSAQVLPLGVRGALAVHRTAGFRFTIRIKTWRTVPGHR